MMHFYVEDSAELQIYIYRPMLNKVHMPLYLFSISLMIIYQTSIGMEKVWGGEGIYYLESEHFKVPLYFWIKYDLGQKYYTPIVRPDRGSNS